MRSSQHRLSPRQTWSVSRLAFTSRQQRDLLNELHEQMWLYHNFLQPVLRQISRETIFLRSGIAHTRRKHDDAKIPLQCLLDAETLSPEQSAALRETYHLISPRQLRHAIDAKLEVLFRTIPR